MSSEVRSHEVFFESDIATPDTSDSNDNLDKAKDLAQAKGSASTYNRLSNAIIKNEINITSSFDTFRGVNRNELNYGPGNESRWGIDSRTDPLSLEYNACESVHERLTRIKLELADVMGDIENLQSKASTDGAASTGGSSDVWSYLQKEAGELVAESEHGLQVTAASPVLSGSLPPVPPAPSALDAASPAGRAHGYANDPSSNTSLLQLEQRVHVLETLLGYGPDSGLMVPGSAPGGVIEAAPLVTLLTAVEKKLTLMDAAAVEALRKKIPAVKKEMDTLLNTAPKGSMAAGSSSTAGQTTGLKVLEAAVIIESLYTKSSSYDTIIDDIPHIVSRLKTLQGLHQEQSGYSSRLLALEQLLSSMGTEVAQNAQVLDTVASEMKANVATFDENVQQIEKRLAALPTVSN